MVPLCRLFVELCRGDYDLARICSGCCNRWQQKLFLFARSSWYYAAGEKKMLAIVVASVKGGSENGFSLPVLRGTMLRL